ncbi:MAG: hypothetical protein HY042_00380 [Spirochaetia bacterium]|nr:hypothetical protein [Spirochaetia bacterium]
MEGKIVAVLVYETGPTTKTLEDESRRRIERLYPGLPVFSNKDGAPNPVQGSQYECAKSALDTSARSPDDSIAFLCNHSPLLDDALAKEAEAEHFRFFAQYSYGENIPRGLIPDFISKDFVDSAAPVTGDLREFVARSLE